jgi:hypothetical protein
MDGVDDDFDKNSFKDNQTDNYLGGKMNVTKYQNIKCKNDECGQEFNRDNVKLAVLLYGVILLKQNETQDDSECSGYIGLKCPKCLNHSLFRTSAQAVQDFKNYLQSGSTLKYYSPFFHEDLYNLEGFDIERFTFQEPEDDPYFSDELYIHTAEDDQMLSLNLSSRFCSYVWDRDDRPAGYSTWVCWFQENEIEALSDIEKMNELQIFPRYYHMSDLVRKIDSLLKYKYFYGKQIDQAKSEWDKSIKENPQKTKIHWSEKLYEAGPFAEKLDPERYIYHENPAEQQQKEIANDIRLTGRFMEVLIAEPCPLKDAFGSPQKNCDYLWAVTDPFHQKEFPSESVPEIDIIENQNKEGFDTEIIDFVKKHFTKQYAQDYLVENLEDFLEEYQELILSNRFSYARVWNLKQSYLEGLKKAIDRGLSKESPFSFHYEGPGWLIRFNNQWVPGLRDKGLQYIYFLLCNKNKQFSRIDLSKVDGVNPGTYLDYNLEKAKKVDEENQEKKKNEKFNVNELIDSKGLAKLKKERAELKQAVKKAEDDSDIAMLEEARKDLEKFETHFQEYWIPKLKKKKTFVDKNVKDASRALEISIERAIEKMKSHNSDLYSHFVESIQGLPRAFYKNNGGKYLFLENYMLMYKPDPDVEWHLD